MIKKALISLFFITIFSIGYTTTDDIAEASSSYHDKAIKTAKSLIGTKYLAGGSSPAGFDCSGLVSYAFAEHGLDLPRTVATMYDEGKKVKKLKKGDLLFFAPNKASKPTHVAIYVGKNKFIHSSSSKGVTITKTSNLYWEPRYIGAKRI